MAALKSSCVLCKVNKTNSMPKLLFKDNYNFMTDQIFCGFVQCPPQIKSNLICYIVLLFWFRLDTIFGNKERFLNLIFFTIYARHFSPDHGNCS